MVSLRSRRNLRFHTYDPTVSSAVEGLGWTRTWSSKRELTRLRLGNTHLSVSILIELGFRSYRRYSSGIKTKHPDSNEEVAKTSPFDVEKWLMAKYCAHGFTVDFIFRPQRYKPAGVLEASFRL